MNRCNPFTGLSKVQYMKQYGKVRYEANKEAVAVLGKVYRENHKEEIKARYKKYYENHKDAIISRQTEKVTCEHCNSIVAKGNMPRHLKTKKCQNSRNQ